MVLLSWSLMLLTSTAWARGDAPVVAPPQALEVGGQQVNSYYYPPQGSKKSMKPVVVWMHGRSGNAEADCRKWKEVATEFGWLLCVSGTENRGAGARGWANSWPQAKVAVDAALDALKKKYPKRVQSKNNILIGFSEGAFTAMNIGVREPEVFSRWLILAASDIYWGGEGRAELKKNRKQIKRVYLLTGGLDMVAPNTKRVKGWVDEEKVKVKMWLPEDIGHEVPGDRMKEFYRRPLRWLNDAKK
ncbi:MAG: hypothetical protein U0165_00800 [Polyangiaceae bacterium]